MANLDNIKAMQELDLDNILGNIQDLPNQVEKTWEQWRQIPLPTHYVNAKSVLILGMGGSAQAGSIVSALAHQSSPIPIEVLRDYEIPGWVDKNTLIIASSYSGETEETIEALSAAAKLTDKIITLSTGGRIYSIGSRSKALHYQIKYSAEPRAALGITLTAVLAIFKKLNLIELTDDDLKETALLLRALRKKIDVEIPERRNIAKVLAGKINGRFPIIYASGNLTEVARRVKGQFNENAKTASYYEIIPELNHNSLVGLEFPSELRQKIFVLILQSKYDHQRNRLRQNITAQILEQKKIPYETMLIQPAPNPVSELFQVIMLGDYISYYLAMIYNVAPNPVKIVEFLKAKLAEEPFFGSSDKK